LSKVKTAISNIQNKYELVLAAGVRSRLDVRFGSKAEVTP
jgi:hypothetical protein